MTGQLERRLSILVVEDNPADVRLLEEAAREAELKADLTTAADGERALAHMRNGGRPDLVLLDLNLPRKNGLEVLEEMRADPDLACVPVIMLTTSSAEHDVVACYSRGANCFVVKPLELDAFMDLIGAIRRFWLGVARLPSAG